MVRIKNGRLYDTDHAILLCDCSNHLPLSNPHELSALLYMKMERDEFFLFGTGGAESLCPTLCHGYTYEDVFPVDESVVKEILGQQEPGLYVRLFGPVTE